MKTKVNVIEKPLDDFFAAKGKQYGKNFLTTLANKPGINSRGLFS